MCAVSVVLWQTRYGGVCGICYIVVDQVLRCLVGICCIVIDQVLRCVWYLLYCG